MEDRACVYTVLVGGYEELLEQPVAHSSKLDFVVFTDDHDLSSDTWQVRAEDLILPQDPARSSRYAKLLPHRALGEYDVSIYIDNSVLLREPPETILGDLFPVDAVFALNAHDFRETVRDEFEAVIRRELDTPWVCAEQLEHYESWRPEVLQERPLWCGFMIRRHHDPLLIRTMELWWTQVLRYSRRDQLSIMMSLRQTGLEPTVLPNETHSSKYHLWPQDVGRIPSRGGKLAGMAELRDCKDELAVVSRRAAESEAETDSLRRDLDVLGREVANRDEVLQLMLDSTSWRITAPLRSLGARARRRS